VSRLRVYDLSDRFRIIENDKDLIENAPSNIGGVLGDTEKVLVIIRNVPVKELCQGIVN
jgi:hypothetical protein